MFVFASILISATWFAARLLWDFLLRPSWRGRRDRARRRFACITGTGVIIAAAGFGGIIAALYGRVAGLVAAAALVPVYLFIGTALFVLLQSFDSEPDH